MYGNGLAEAAEVTLHVFPLGTITRHAVQQQHQRPCGADFGVDNLEIVAPGCLGAVWTTDLNQPLRRGFVFERTVGPVSGIMVDRKINLVSG
jgi:hypothetical protein